MKKRNTAIALILLLAMLSASACGQKAAETETVPTADTAETEMETETVDPNDRSQIPDTLPDDLDFGGRTLTMYVPDSSAQNNYYAGNEEKVGEIVNDAVVARNLAVEERLNISLSYIPQEVGGNDFPEKVSPLLMAGDTSYDVFLGAQWGQIKLVTIGGIVNLYDLDHIDFSQPWWWNTYMDALTMGEGARYFAVGDFFIQSLMYARTVFYNKAMYEDNFGDGNGLYNIVLEGKWTLDKMAEMAETVYVDTNNNGVTDIDDQLGYITYLTMSSADGFVYGSDIEFCSRSDDGGIVLNMMQDDAVTLAEKLVGFFYQPGSLSQVESSDPNRVFMEDRALFLGNAGLSNAQDLRDMETDFGMVPYPKLDEEQENYRSLVHDGTLIASINGSSENLDMVGAALEALCAETYRSVTPVWYETALKIKYSRDDISSQMIDLIHDSTYTSFIYAYNYAINNIGMVYRTLVTKNSTDYVSAVKSLETSAQKSLDELFVLFKEATAQ